jgi:hypothetical protein
MFNVSISYYKRAWKIALATIKTHFWNYLLITAIALAASATVFLLPYAMLFMFGAHEMLIDEGRIDWRKLLKKMDQHTDYWKLLILYLVKGVIITAGYALLFVPGIILLIALLPLDYLIFHGTEVKMGVAIPASIDAMQGQKTKFFWTLIGFVLVGIIAYLILVMLILVIGFLPIVLAQIFFIIILVIAILLATIFYIMYRLVVVLFLRDVFTTVVTDVNE